MRWSWLRVGRRIEWVMGGLFLFGLFLFGARGLYFHHLLSGLLIGAYLTFFIVLPFFILLLRRRKREAILAVGASAQPRKRFGRVSLYLLLFALTLVSATLQVTHGMVSLAGSVRAVYLWNLAGLLVVVGWNEWSVRKKRNRLQRANP
jgi:hypothetical protein